MSRRSILAVMVTFLAPATLAEADCPPITPSEHWKHTVEHPWDPFFSMGIPDGIPGWGKFTILLCDPSKVYFQHSWWYPFHYDFATALLDPYIGISPEAYDQITLYEDGQEAVLGAVLLPAPVGYPSSSHREYGIQFVRQDPYDPQMVVDLFQAVQASVVAEPDVQAFYFPTFEQTESAEQHREFFAQHGIEISSTARWAINNPCYSNGWALGRLKYFEAHQIESAYLTGQLDAGDILLTDGVPAEIPLVAGILTLSPSSPSSHVAILANTYGVPFAHLAKPADAQRALDLVGRRIVLRAYQELYTPAEVRLFDVEDVLTEDQMGEILTLKQPPALNILAMADFGSLSAPTDGLVPADIQYFGGKAANFGFLRRAIPDASPVSLAISFDLWNEFLDQTMPTGNSLRSEIPERLAAYSWPPDNLIALADDLDDIRDMIRDDTVFTPGQQAAIIAILQDPQHALDPATKIRFRSSTNVEDSEQFTGAGLYDSFSGCLADDLDGDQWGPSICDETKPTERGVCRAIRKVFASFYNDNAFLERLRYSVNENEVGMALLVHHSFPDEIELANGVATLPDGGPALLVTQLGAVSVANPEGGARPEEVRVTIWGTSMSPTVERYSDLVILGDTVMDWTEDYTDLTQLLVSVADTFEQETGKTGYVLDFEYKKVAPDGQLIVKQVREVPQPDDTPSITPFLINEPVELCTTQGEFEDVYFNHHLKSRWYLETGSMWLTPEVLAESIYTDARLEFTDGCRVYTLGGSPGEWPEAYHSYEAAEAVDRWALADLDNPRVCELHTYNVPELVAPSKCPLLVASDFRWLLQVEHAEPVRGRHWDGTPIMTTSEETWLNLRMEPHPDDLLQERFISSPDGFTVTTSYYWPPPPTWVASWYTAPLSSWVETVIEGLTSEPIVLHDYYSQTYRPGHHNITEYFIFHPRLEPGIDEQTLAELEAAGVEYLFVDYGYSSAEIITHDAEVDCACDMADFFEFHDCLSGAGASPEPTPPRTADVCRTFHDYDGDGDVDLADFGQLQVCFGGT